MKQLAITTMMALLCVVSGMAQRQTESIKKEIQFEKTDTNNVFYLNNINGEIKVEGYSGNTILIEARKTISAKTEDRIQKGLKEISVEVIDRYDTMIVYMKGPCGDFVMRTRNKGNNGRKHWNYNWNNCHEQYDFQIDYIIKVPYIMNLVLSTINDGDVEVKGVSGSLEVNNINGAIALSGIENRVKVHTINGDVDLNFNKNPTIDSDFYTLNGDINANFKPGLSADMSFKSFNGEFYTNLTGIEQLPVKLEKSIASNKRGISFKLDSKLVMRARTGGVYLDFETFNGDVFVKENN
jgi:hypothetical protein